MHSACMRFLATSSWGQFVPFTTVACLLLPLPCRHSCHHGPASPTSLSSSTTLSTSPSYTLLSSSSIYIIPLEFLSSALLHLALLRLPYPVLSSKSSCLIRKRSSYLDTPLTQIPRVPQSNTLHDQPPTGQAPCQA
ncbi:hypothetical protein DE146DRAFT_436771 [Phaeosphaeria sp. MPI-PUGE-AT-0046c]|nr:hypothetical protein DE146DRAFT_436771 [Phaeosphaeria sp. MPI-PUGE-AT-0046c]